MWARLGIGGDRLTARSGWEGDLGAVLPGRAKPTRLVAAVMDREAGRADNRLTVLALMNAFTQGMSGGDAWFMEVARRLPEVRWVVVTSSLGKKACESYGLVADYIITTDEDNFEHVIWTYAKRTVRGLRLTRQLQPDVVEALSDAPPDVVVAVACKLRGHKRGTRYVQRVYHLVPFRRGRTLAFFVQRAVHVMAALAADMVVTDSVDLRRAVGRRWPRPRIAVVSRPGVEVPDLGDEAKGSSVARYDGLYVGRLHPSKGIFDLPLIWKQVLQTMPGARLGIAGYGPSETEGSLRAALVREGVAANVDVLGFVGNEEAWALRQRAKVFLVPSHEEGFGLGVLEALVAGLPVVAWDLDVYNEHFATGLVQVPEGDVCAFGSAVGEVLRHPELRLKVLAEASSYAKRFDWRGTAAWEYEQVLLGGTAS